MNRAKRLGRRFARFQQDARMPEFQDRILSCLDCGADFVFSAGEQHFYREKNFNNEPRRFKACNSKRQKGAPGRRGFSGSVETATVCSQCSKETTVPFLPTQGRPVLCRDYFRDSRSAATS